MGFQRQVALANQIQTRNSSPSWSWRWCVFWECWIALKIEGFILKFDNLFWFHEEKFFHGYIKSYKSQASSQKKQLLIWICFRIKNTLPALGFGAVSRTHPLRIARDVAWLDQMLAYCIVFINDGPGPCWEKGQLPAQIALRLFHRLFWGHYDFLAYQKK